MLTDKQKLIMKEGIPVKVHPLAGAIQSTRCLYGKATKQFNNTMSLEYQRRAHFLPTVALNNGYLVEETITGEYFIVVAAYNEFLNKKFGDIIVHMFKCNASITVGRDVQTADNKGNIKNVPQTIYDDLKVYVETVKMDLLETKPGLFPNTDAVIYAPGVEITTLDRVTMNLDGRQVPVKVLNPDYASYPGLVCIEVSSETRK